MSLSLAIYLIGILDGLKVVCVAACFIVGASTLVLIMSACMSSSDGGPLPYPASLLKTGIISFFSLLALQAFIPSSRTVAAMVVIPAIVENKNVQEIAGSSLDGLRLLVKKWVTDLAKEEEK